MIIKPTADQQKHIKDTTGRSVSELPIEFTNTEFSDEELEKVSAGGDTVQKAGSGTTSGGGVYLRYTF